MRPSLAGDYKTSGGALICCNSHGYIRFIVIASTRLLQLRKVYVECVVTVCGWLGLGDVRASPHRYALW